MDFANRDPVLFLFFFKKIVTACFQNFMTDIKKEEMTRKSGKISVWPSVHSCLSLRLISWCTSTSGHHKFYISLLSYFFIFLLSYNVTSILKLPLLQPWICKRVCFYKKSLFIRHKSELSIWQRCNTIGQFCSLSRNEIIFSQGYICDFHVVEKFWEGHCVPDTRLDPARWRILYLSHLWDGH